ncbi:hypothetical protein SADUNF_Sadunf06G0070000 [Salix dunnii]|uniref:Pentatricopeptide repeat-containing protein n=1 Tax=Salix dunnii TaxID=1413687 RepID=A0A835K3G6_9ROSI|nr:hypothetical protein SADUNF_Sadunf06G0070000 [Salix dunnii]
MRVVVFLACGTGATSSYWFTNLTVSGSICKEFQAFRQQGGLFLALAFGLEIHGHMLKRTIFSKAPTSTLLNISASSSSANPPYNITTCINASLRQCAINKNLKKGRQLHARLLITGLSSSSPSCTTSLINMYAKCNQMNHALLVLNRTADYARNVFAYNALISGFILNGLPKDGLEVYEEMRLAGIFPDKYTFPCLIKGFCEVMEVFQVKKMHGLVFKLGLDLDMYVGSSLVSSYLKSELMKEARELFDEMPERDVVLWNSVVNGYAQTGQFDEALRVCREMSQEGVLMSKFTVSGVLSVFSARGDFANGRLVHGFMIKMGFDSCLSVCNALIDMYGKCRRVVDALEIFEKMNEKDILSWNSILSANEHCCDHDGTLRLFDRMLGEGVQLDLVTITTILPACSHLAALVHGREIHGYMIVNGFIKDDLAEVAAQKVLELNPAHCGNYVLMSNAYVAAGRYQEVLDIRHKMRQQDVKKTPGCSWIELKNGMNTFINGDRTHPEARLIYPELHLLAAHIHEHGYVPLL